MLKGPQFDHELALKLHAEGKNLREISSIIGVARTSVRRVVDPEYKAAEAQYKKDILEGKRHPTPQGRRAYPPGSARVPLSVSLSKEQLEILDQEAEKREISRSTLVREALEQWMERETTSKPKSKGWRRHDGASGETRTTRNARQNPDHPE